MHIFHLTQDSATLRNMPQASSADTPRATDRGLSLVRAIADRPHGLTLADLAREVKLSPSTTLRQVRALEAAGFATRRVDGGWAPGPELLRIARCLTAAATLPRLAEPVLMALADATEESAYLAEAVDANEAVYVAMAPGRHSIRHVSWLGHTIARHETALGCALAADVDDDGVAVRHDAVEQGVTAISAPVRDASGHIVAALSVVGPSFRLDEGRMTEVRSTVAAHAASLSRLAGHSPAP
jgi:DNA-binding IclR family transcriptional regulator